MAIRSLSQEDVLVFLLAVDGRDANNDLRRSPIDEEIDGESRSGVRDGQRQRNSKQPAGTARKRSRKWPLDKGSNEMRHTESSE